MSDAHIQETVVKELAEGALWTSELLERLRSELDSERDPTGDLIKAAIWDLVEWRRVRWAPDGRIALVAEEAHA